MSSRLQLPSQPSPSTRLPSSQISLQPGSTIPSPQTNPGSLRHVALQPSQLRRLPSSHSSPLSTTPSPPSRPLSTTPSPRCARRQSLRHASATASLLAAPSSHCSHCATATPSPQTATPGVQSDTTEPYARPPFSHPITNASLGNAAT